MNRETLLAGGVVAILATGLLAVAAVPDALGQPADRGVRAGDVALEELTVAAADVSGGTATLAVDTRMTHRGGPAENISVLLRAVDEESGMVAAARTLPVGTVADDGEVAVEGEVTVDREGAYRLETLVFADGRRVDEGAKTVAGLDRLQPAYADSPVEFHRFEAADLPTVEFAVEDAGDGRATLDVTGYLTNTGDDAAGDLRVVYTARQADSNIVADRASVDVGDVRPGRTATPTAALSVPDDYNYYLDAVLWRDGVVVDTARAPANLHPDGNVTVGSGTEESAEGGLEVGDFERNDRSASRDSDSGSGHSKAKTTEAAGPGFGVGAAVAALLGLCVAARRWSA